jgi:formate dehydrogenase major subunit
MTNHWIDLRNSDCILINGSNAAENHPISFKWVQKAIEKGAKLISVDPRFTRTSSKAHIYAPIRSGTDIAFLGGMIKYITDNELFFKEYLAEYTNAAFILNPDFKLPVENNGVFSGLSGNKYDKSTWAFVKDGRGVPVRDKTLSDPRCVFQLLKKEFDRYDLDTVSQVTGTPVDKLEEIYKAYGSTGTPDRSGTIMYAMGWTQHTVGVQNIRTMAIIQLLLGNMGVAGGGVNALRGESNVQGSTDHCLLFHILPGYLTTPNAGWATLDAYKKAKVASVSTNDPTSASWWTNYPKYIVSLLRAHYGLNVSPEQAYLYLPKLDVGGNYSWLTIWDEVYKENIKGVFAWGQNPACSGANSNKVRKGLAKLDWLVNVNIFDNETGSFWKGPGMNPADINTEVFMLPCAGSVEKEGSITNSGRWMQWRYKAVNPPGSAKPDGDIISELYAKIKERMEATDSIFKEAFTQMTWDYVGSDVLGNPTAFDAHLAAKKINGFFLEDKEVKGTLYKKGDLVPSFAFLQDDGSTCSGNWLYSQSYNASGNNAARRSKVDKSGIGLYLEWAWCWPVNRRIIYNRASVDLDGKPWAPHKPVVRWTGSGWKGDVPDGGWPPLNMPGTRLPFIMKPDGVASVFGPGRADGPFPTHYEPMECPVEGNLINPDQLINPTVHVYDTEADAFAEVCDPNFPIVASTYRVSEHWQTGIMTRWQPWLAEMQPANFVEMSEELAKQKKIKNGEVVKVISARGEVEAVAIVTKRFKPLQIAGKELHQVGIPWHYGWRTAKNGQSKDPYAPVPEVLTFGDSANILTPSIGDPNTRIPETKTFLVNVEKK